MSDYQVLFSGVVVEGDDVAVVERDWMPNMRHFVLNFKT